MAPVANKSSIPVDQVLFARPVVDDQHLIEVRPEQGDKSLVRGMGQIDFSRLLTVEAHQKTMREALVEIFRTVIRAPFKIADLFDLSRQGPKGVLNFPDGFRRTALFKGEEDHMAEFPGPIARCLGKYRAKNR